MAEKLKQVFPMTRDEYMEGLNNLSSIDGRESPFTAPMRPYFSEAALHRNRTRVDLEELIAAADAGVPGSLPINPDDKVLIRTIYAPESFDATAVAEYDHFTRNGIGPLEHDVKANEMYARERFDALNLARYKEMLHYPLTSEDTNSPAWALMTREGINNVWIPQIIETVDKIANFAEKHAHVPVIGRTHGMKASTTTIGKRFSYTVDRMTKILERIEEHKLSAKFSGPVGNHNAPTVVDPDFDFEDFAKDFIEGMGFEYEDNSTQRSSHLRQVELLNHIRNFNIMAADFCGMIRKSAEMGLLRQEEAEEDKATHVGSSVMPHKVNPWLFEAAQGLFEKSDSLIEGAAEGLLMSDFERDLTDHPWEREYGTMFGLSLAGMKYISDGLNTLEVDSEAALKELQTSPEVLSEAVQITGRFLGVSDIYTKIKLATRGRALTRETINEIIEEYIPDGEEKERLKKLKPENYYGIAPEIAIRTVERYRKVRERIKKGVLDDSKKKDAVLFDFDGTLQTGDKEELFDRLSEISARMGLGFTPEQISEFGNRSDYLEMRKLMVVVYNLENPTGPITEDEFEEVGKGVSGMFDHHFHLADWGEEVLSTLKRSGKKLGIVTTRGANSLPRILQKYNIEHYFDVVVNRADVPDAKKPHPKPIAVAMEKLGEFGIDDPSRVIYVGDLQYDDVIAGNAVGLTTVLVNNDPLDKYGAKPDYHFSSLKPILKHFGR